MRLTSIVCLASLVLLAACGRNEPEIPKEAQAQVDLFEQPWLARGNEPFWAVKIDKDALTLQQPGHGDAVAKVETRTLTDDTATWLAREPAGGVVVLTLRRAPCSDGMSDRRYGFSAELELPAPPQNFEGVVHYGGCAGPAAALSAQPHG